VTPLKKIEIISLELAAENKVAPKEGGEGDDIYETKVLLTKLLVVITVLWMELLVLNFLEHSRLALRVRCCK